MRGGTAGGRRPSWESRSCRFGVDAVVDCRGREEGRTEGRASEFEFRPSPDFSPSACCQTRAPDQNPRLNPPYSYVDSSGSVSARYSAQV